MTETTPDYEGLNLIAEAITEWFGERCPDYAEGCYSCEAWKEYDRLRALLERNKELERERNQLLDKLHCMCGSPIDHSAWEGHTPVSVYDYSLDQERSRAEAAEARLAEAMKVIGQIDTALNDQFAAGIEEREGGSARRQESLMKSGEELRRAARKLLKENGNGE